MKIITPEEPQKMQEDAVYAEGHSLFWETHEPSLEPLETETGSFYEQKDGFTLYKLFVGDFKEEGNGLQRIVNKLQESSPGDQLELHISSRGGITDELLELYNLVDNLFNQAATFANYAYSAGAWAFLFGKERVLFEHSSIMFHSYSAGFGGKRQDLMDQIKHEDRRLEKFLFSSLSPYFSKKELKKMNAGKAFWIDTPEACERGICTHVLIHGEMKTAKEYLEIIKPSHKKTKKKTKKKQKNGYYKVTINKK